MINLFYEEHDDLILPVYASKNSAGADIYAAETLDIFPGQTALIGTNLKVALEEGYELQVRPRSGLSLKTTLRIANSPGTIDADYRDEIKIIVHNTANYLSSMDAILAGQEIKDYQIMPLAKYLSLKQRELEPRLELLADLPVVLDLELRPYGTIRVEKGERIAQLLLAQKKKISWQPCPDVAKLGSNRGGGFGSTGQKGLV